MILLIKVIDENLMLIDLFKKRKKEKKKDMSCV